MLFGLSFLLVSMPKKSDSIFFYYCSDCIKKKETPKSGFFRTNGGLYAHNLRSHGKKTSKIDRYRIEVIGDQGYYSCRRCNLNNFIYKELLTKHIELCHKKTNSLQ